MIEPLFGDHRDRDSITYLLASISLSDVLETLRVYPQVVCDFTDEIGRAHV